jgi:CDP-glucose 4,6-dehydratase
VHVLVTGHTGFKGSWLALMLAHRGHEVSGFALDPVPDGLFALAGVSDVLTHDLRGDLRSPSTVNRAVEDVAPDAVVHMAAQPLVRASLADPRTTLETNLVGTLNVLEAIQRSPSVRAHVVVTTDKVYRNDDCGRPFREADPLGGHDPYSASKAMVELLVESWSASFAPCPTATARAGNVIGGGDVSTDRLLPDLLHAMTRDELALIRYPDSTRPWQHVLDALDGYLRLLDALLDGTAADRSWNFGPSPASFRTVAEVADRVAAMLGRDNSWELDPRPQPAEARRLVLDSSRSMQQLGWRPRLNLDGALRLTVDWTQQVRAGGSPAEISRRHLVQYENLPDA